MHRHVYLVGLIDHVIFKEWLATKTVRLEIHDNDEYVAKEDEEDAKFSFGCASFSLSDFLKPKTRSLKLRSDVFPLKREQPDLTKNLDLNTTARKGERQVEKGSPYLINSTYAILAADLAHPIAKFDEEKELKEALRLKEEASKLDEESQPTDSKAQLKGRPGSKEAGKRPPSSKASLQKKEEEPEKVERAEDVIDDFDENEAIFERAIIIIPYKSPDNLKRIQDSVDTINMEGLGFDSVRYLNTKELDETERANRRLDFVGGFELIDSEFRMFILEGIGGLNRGMDKFYQMNLRDQPNNRKYKLLYNPLVRFKNRLYLDFNVSIKKIKLRDPLTQTMGSPDVYLRSKVPEDMYDTLQKFAEIRKLDRISLVKEFNLWPFSDKLEILERKYGDALRHMDLYGVP
jgi:hypothetical protein